MSYWQQASRREKSRHMIVEGERYVMNNSAKLVCIAVIGFSNQLIAASVEKTRLADDQAVKQQLEHLWNRLSQEWSVSSSSAEYVSLASKPFRLRANLKYCSVIELYVSLGNLDKPRAYLPIDSRNKYAHAASDDLCPPDSDGYFFTAFEPSIEEPSFRVLHELLVLIDDETMVDVKEVRNGAESCLNLESMNLILKEASSQPVDGSNIEMTVAFDGCSLLPDTARLYLVVNANIGSSSVKISQPTVWWASASQY